MKRINKRYIDSLIKKYKVDKINRDHWQDVAELGYTCTMVELSTPLDEKNLLDKILEARLSFGARAVVCNVTCLKARKLLEKFGFSKAGKYLGGHRRYVYTYLANITRI